MGMRQCTTPKLKLKSQNKIFFNGKCTKLLRSSSNEYFEWSAVVFELHAFPHFGPKVFVLPKTDITATIQYINIYNIRYPVSAVFIFVLLLEGIETEAEGR